MALSSPQSSPCPADKAAVPATLPHTAYLALGSNLGDRHAYLQAAADALAAHPEVTLIATSAVYETQAVGPIRQGPYLNAALAVRTSLSALELLRTGLRIEADNCRIRAERFGPRTLDIDLLWHSNCAHSHDPELTLPHPRLHERAFVLAPLADIAPQLMIDGDSVTALLQRSERSGVARTALQLSLH